MEVLLLLRLLLKQASVVGCATMLMHSAAARAEPIDIPYTQVQLDNGLTLIVHEDRKSPIVAVNIWYHVGSKNEVPGRTGFAHLFEHLMFQGSENFDDEYTPFLQQLGATDLNATTWFDRTNYFQTVPKNALDAVLWLESDRMGHFIGSISQDKLDEQRGVVQNEKRQGDNQPYGKVWTHLLKQVFPVGHPYSWETIGSMEDLNAATLGDVREWFETYYGPDNAVLVIAGDVTADDVIARVEKYFGDIPPGPPLTRPGTWIPHLDTGRRMSMQDRVPQARIYMAWSGPQWGTRDAHHLELAADILGADKHSRLYKRLVYEDQIATDVTVAPLALEISGVSYLVASAQPGVPLNQVEAALNEEIASFVDKGPTRQELERAQTQQRASFLRGVEGIGGFSGKSGVLAQNMVYGGAPDRYKQRLKDIDQATPEDLRQVAERWLGPNAFVLEVQPYPELVAAASGADRGAVPEPTAFPDVSFPKFERAELANGLQLIVAQRAGVPLVEMELILDAGYAADQFGLPGTSTLALSMLDEGTLERSSLEISEELALQGARLRAGSRLDSSYVRLSALRANLDESLEIFADVTLNPSFPDTELQRLRRIALANIQQEKNRPISMALRLLPKILYGPDHPYGQPLTGSGTEAAIRAMSRDDLVRFHQTWFKPNRATLVVAGDISVEEILPRLEQLFGSWEAGAIPDKDISVTANSGGRTLYLVDRPDADQSVIFAGQLLPPKANRDEVAIQAMNNILGGLSSARLNMNLREDKHWSYGAYSLIVDARGQRPLLAYAPVQTDKTRESIQELQREIEGIREAQPPTSDELTMVKRSDTLSLPGRWESNADVVSSLSEVVRFGLPEDYWSTYAERVNSLELTDVGRAARDFVEPDKFAWVVVGDRSRIEADLRDLGFDEIRLIDAEGEPLADRSAALN
jgi:zinc protease